MYFLTFKSFADLIDINEGYMGKSFGNKFYDGLLELHVDGVHVEGTFKSIVSC